MLAFMYAEALSCRSLLDSLSPHFETLQNREDAKIVIVSLDADPLAITRVQRREPWNLPWPIIVGAEWGESQLAKDYGVVAVPEVLLIDPEGRIAGLHLRQQRLLEVLDVIMPL